LSATTKEPPDDGPPGKAKLHGPNWGLLPHQAALRDEFKPGALNPVCSDNPEFDWETVFTHCDGDVTGDTETKRLAIKMAAGVMTTLFDWLLKVNLRDQRALKSIGVRAVVMAWVVNPARFEGASLTTLAKSLGYRSHKAISPEAAEFSRDFGIKNSFQAHDSSKKRRKVMLHPPPKIKSPAAPASAGGNPKGKTISLSSTNGHAANAKLLFTRSIPASDDDHDGLEVYVGGMGDVVLRLLRPYTHTEEIVLHVAEALTLCGLLPAAITAADKYRRTL
jgi:hypothetical protein